jgi:hypothetical protein
LLSFERPGLSPGLFASDEEDVRVVGLLLIAGAAVTLALHLLGAPEDLYRWSYHHLLSGLDVPPDPSAGTVEAVRYTSLIGGLLQLTGGLAMLAWERGRVGP